jgi:hypothetical protein
MAGDSSDLAVILARLTTQDEAMREIKLDVKDIKSEVKRTNGRVTKLETSEAVRDARAEDHAHDWEWAKTLVITVIAAVLTGAAGSIVVLVIGGHG